MIKLDLKKYVDDSHISINALSKATGISRPTLTNMYAGKATGIQFETLETLCVFFNIGIPDILKRIIDIKQFRYLEISGTNLDTNTNKIIGIQYERTIKNKTDLQTAIFIFSYDKEFSETYNNHYLNNNSLPETPVRIKMKNGKELPQEVKDWLKETNERLLEENNSKRMYFSLELIAPQEADSLNPNIDYAIFEDLKKSNKLMGYNEAVTLYRSLSKELLEQISFKILINFIKNSTLTISKDQNYIFSVNWNLGAESNINSQKYHFEYSFYNGSYMFLRQ